MFIDSRRTGALAASENIIRTKAKTSRIGTHISKIVLSLGLAIGAPVAASADSNTVVAVMRAGLRVLDPILTTAFVTRDHAYMIYDVLVAQDEKYQPQPQMADWKISDDGLTYSFVLRDGILFHDGKPVKSADVIASLKRWGARDIGGKQLFNITASLEAKGDRTIVWKLKEPFSSLIEVLSKPSSIPPFIMPERVANTPPDKAITEYVGSGPFKFVADRFQPGVTAQYEKFEQYVPRKEKANWLAGGKVVNVQRVRWITMPDTQTAINALLASEIDYIETVPVDLLPVVQGNPNIVAEAISPVAYQVIGRMNFKQPPFNNVLARRAALLALSQNDILKTMIGDPRFYKVCGAIFGCGTPLADNSGAQSLITGGGLKEAQELLKKSGYAGEPVVLMAPADVPSLAVPPTVAAQALRKAGFNVQLQSMDWQTLLTRRSNDKSPAEGGWSMFFTIFGVPEVASPLSNLMISGRGNSAWFGWPDSLKLEQLLQSINRAKTTEERKQIARQIQIEVLEQVVYVPLGEYQDVQVRSKKVVDIVPAPSPVFWGLRKTQ